MEKYACSWIGILSVVKLAIFPQFIYKFNTVPVRILADFLPERDRLILKFIWECKAIRIARTILKNNKTVGLTFSYFKIYYKDVVIKTVLYRQKDRHIDKWDRVENTEIIPYIVVNWLLIRMPRQFDGKRTVFSKSIAGHIAQGDQLSTLWPPRGVG